MTRLTIGTYGEVPPDAEIAYAECSSHIVIERMYHASKGPCFDIVWSTDIGDAGGLSEVEESYESLTDAMERVAELLTNCGKPEQDLIWTWEEPA